MEQRNNKTIYCEKLNPYMTEWNLSFLRKKCLED